MHRPKLLIVANIPSENTRLLRAAIADGAKQSVGESIDIIVKQPLETNSEDFKLCNGVIIGTTENFGYMSGLIKDLFERIYYDCLEKTQALPFALYVRAGQDGQGTLTAVQRITAGLRWKLIQEPVLLHGKFDKVFIEQCETLGATVALGLEAGIY